MKRRLTKTLLYRVSTILLAQIICWLAFGKIEINGIVISMDIIQTGWYYLYDWSWERTRHGNFRCPKCGKRTLNIKDWVRIENMKTARCANCNFWFDFDGDLI